MTTVQMNALEPFSTTKMATAGIERSVDSTIETALI